MESVIHYLQSSRSWSDLIMIYADHGKNQTLLETGQKLSNHPGLRKAMEAELQQLVDAMQAAVKEPTVQLSVDASFVHSVESVRAKRLTLFKRAAYLHAQLSAVSSIDKRKEIVDTLEITWIQIDQLWYLEDYYNAHQVWPIEEITIADKELNAHQLLKLLHNLRSRISKMRADFRNDEIPQENWNENPVYMSLMARRDFINLLIQTTE